MNRLAKLFLTLAFSRFFREGKSEFQDPSAVVNSSCIDVPEWHDSNGYICSDIELFDDETRESMCSDTAIIEGRTAYSACCSCGGGFSSSSKYADVFVAEPPESVACMDYFNWITVDEQTCDSYHNDDQSDFRCDFNGYLEGIPSNIPGSTACCECGGGYRGKMLKKRLRVGIPSDASSIYLLYTRNNIDGMSRDGSILHFTKGVLKSLGLGIYPVDEYSPSAIAEYPGKSMDKSYSRCMFDVSRGNVDICIGPFWSTLSRSNMANMTLPMAESTFYIVSPVVQSSIWESVLSVGKSFDEIAWMTILAMIAYAGIVLHIITRDSADEAKVVNGPCSFLSQSLHICYVSIRSFVASDTVESQDNPTKVEKIVVIGFVVFSLLIITAYTATAAAFMVLEGSPVVYESLSDFLSDTNARACTYGSAMQDIIFKEPEFDGRLYGLSGGSTELIDSLGTTYDDDTCNIIMLPLEDYEILVAQDDSYCERTKILLDDVSVIINSVIMINPHLDFVDELVTRIDENIDNGLYSMVYNRYYTTMKEVNFNPASVSLLYDAADSTRYLKGSAAISSSSSSGMLSSKTSSFCSHDADGDDENVTLSVKELAFPLIVTFLCSSIGLLSYLVSKSMRNVKLIEKDLSAKSTEDNIDELRLMISSMTPEDIFNLLRSVKLVEQDEIDTALNMLPDKSGLVDLIWKHKYAASRNVRESLMKLNISELVGIIMEAERCDHLTKKTKIYWESALCDVNPKEKLVETILLEEDLFQPFCNKVLKELGNTPSSSVECSPSDVLVIKKYGLSTVSG